MLGGEGLTLAFALNELGNCGSCKQRMDRHEQTLTGFLWGKRETS